MPREVFNPLDKENLGKSVANALLSQTSIPLNRVDSFYGAGVYALYYSGPHQLYTKISAANQGACNWPMYVGKAIPSGGRKGASLSTSSSSKSLYSRLKKHMASIQDVEKYDNSLMTDHFQVKFLCVDDIWIPLGENLLISKFHPIWNVLIDGFGNNDPGKRRYNGIRPLWDHLHRGREWAEKCAIRSETQYDIQLMIDNYLKSSPSY